MQCVVAKYLMVIYQCSMNYVSWIFLLDIIIIFLYFSSVQSVEKFFDIC